MDAVKRIEMYPQCKHGDQFSAGLCEIVFVAKLLQRSSHCCHLHLITRLPASVILELFAGF